MLKFFDRAVYWLVRTLLPLIIRPKNKVIFISEGPSGCNSYALFAYLSKTSINFEVEFFRNPSPDPSSTIAQYFKKIRLLSSAKLIVTTHGPVSLRGRKEINQR